MQELNFDATDPETLWQFWTHTNRPRPIAFARTIFPDRPKGYVAVVKALGHYAANKAVAMRLRAEGQVVSALQYEDICDRIYDRLPEWAKW